MLQKMLAQPPTPDGALILVDSFQSLATESPTTSSDSLPHGLLVQQAGQSQGFAGPILQLQRPMGNSGGALDQKVYSEMALTQQLLSKSEVYQGLDCLFQSAAVTLLNSETEALQRVVASGARHSVVNLSQGTSIASESFQILAKASHGWTSEQVPDRAEGECLLQNLATAFDLNLEHLKSKDPSVCGPERQKLQQAVVDKAASSFSSPWVESNRAAFRATVAAVESGLNSVVISAGNEAKFKDYLREGNQGLSISLPEQFERNILQNDLITSVGSADGEGGRTAIAPYSNTDASIYANGHVGELQGTSFAAPKIAAVMTELHRQNPTWTSERVESELRRQLSERVDGDSFQYRVLDENQAKELLHNHTWILKP